MLPAVGAFDLKMRPSQWRQFCSHLPDNCVI